MFKTGDKKFPLNYRGINLLRITLKITTKVITNETNNPTRLQNGEQGISCICTDVLVVRRQITVKSIQHNRSS